MVEPAFLALLVAPVSFSMLPASSLLSAPLTAIGVTAVAVAADEEQSAALIGPAKPLNQRDLASIGHRTRERG